MDGIDAHMRSMDGTQKFLFDDAAALYDAMRPVYVPALFHEVIAYAGLGSNSYALEVGIGTGQATLPFLQTGCHNRRYYRFVFGKKALRNLHT